MTDEVRYFSFFCNLSLTGPSTRHDVAVAAVQLAHTSDVPHIDVAPDPRDHDNGRWAGATGPHSARILSLSSATRESSHAVRPLGAQLATTTSDPTTQPPSIRQTCCVPFLACIPMRCQHWRSWQRVDSEPGCAGGDFGCGWLHSGGVVGEQGFCGWSKHEPTWGSKRNKRAASATTARATAT